MSELKNVVRCKSCGEYIELPPQEVKTVVKTEPCRCGMTDTVRESRYIATTICLILMLSVLSLFGGCWMSHYYTTEQIKALPQDYEIKKNPNGSVLDVPCKVEKKIPEPPKK